MTSKILTAAGTIAHSLAHCFPFAKTRKQHPTVFARRQPTPFARVCGLTKTEAEELLDCLEVQGLDACRVVYRPGEGFTVGEDDDRS
jgi:hypothetical protein